MDCCKKGAVSELLAVNYFLSQGFEVFRNIASSGPADLVVWSPRTNETFFVDVKTATRYVKIDGTVRYNYGECQRKPHRFVKYLLVHDGVVIGFADDIQ